MAKETYSIWAGEAVGLKKLISGWPMVPSTPGRNPRGRVIVTQHRTIDGLYRGGNQPVQEQDTSQLSKIPIKHTKIAAG
jgi:hypothetical protein